MELKTTIYRLTALTFLAVVVVAPPTSGAAESGHDSGHGFMVPNIFESSATLKTGVTLSPFHSFGVSISANPSSPWYQATVFCQGIMATESETAGGHVTEALQCETIDGDGDITWMVVLAGQGDSKNDIIGGTGKWKGIKGRANMLGVVRERADQWEMMKWELDWQIDKEPFDYEAAVAAGGYTDVFDGYSFQGPHVTESAKKLTNGLTLDANTQKGVLVNTADPDSPFNHLTWRSHNTTIIQTESGEVLGDTGVFEFVDPDGDLIFMTVASWYREGPGEIYIIGGTGKWLGITGVGTIPGMLTQRSDDHFQPKVEIHWKIER